MEVIYKLCFTTVAEDDILKWKKSGQKSKLTRISKLLSELEIHPCTGTGKPEQLRFDLTGKYSRRIDDKNRLVYQIDTENFIVTILSLYGHY